MIKNNKITKSAIYSLLGLSLIALVYYIFNFTELYFSSDGAAIVLLAREQLSKMQFIPDGFYYSTGIFIISPGLFIIPLMLFIKDWLLCRKIAVLLFACIIFTLIFLFYRKIDVDKKKSYAPFIAIIMMCLPMGHYQETYFDAGYATLLLAELTIFLLLFEAINTRQNAKKTALCFMGLFISVFLFNTGSMHNQAIIMIPLVLTILLYAFVEYCMCGDLVLKSKKVVMALGVFVVGACTAFISYKFLVVKVGLEATTGGITFSTTINGNLNAMPQILLSFYNAMRSCELLSLSGILNCMNFVLFVIATVIVPILSIIVYGKIENKFLKFYIIYTWISDFIVMYMILSTTAFVGANRYYQTIFFHKLLLTALLINYLLKHKMQIVRVCFLSAVLVTVILSHMVYTRENTIAKREYDVKNEYSITDYLKDNDLTYGYATFWNAYENMVLANGEITIAGVLPGGNIPYNWLTSKEWYDTEKYSGRCFFMLSEGETISNQFYEIATEIKYFQEYTILIFEDNFLKYQFESDITLEEEITVDDLKVGDNAYVHSDEIILKKNGLQYGPYINMDKGLYEVEISGTNLDQVTTEIIVNMSEKGISHNIIEKSKNKILISYEISKDGTTVEIINKNKSDVVASIKGMLVKKKL